MPHPDDQDEGIEEVRRRLARVRDERDVRWQMSPHTLELAITAIEGALPPRPRTSAGKGRRRRRHKRLL